uniref:[histone H4]-lysine(20) N-methyltransferase n=1 Tax=Timema monikensis TaxID=170555 RepID=A0A7R9EIV2_9NEOP|nr:unnamed protein product [Timema monikensis]
MFYHSDSPANNEASENSQNAAPIASLLKRRNMSRSKTVNLVSPSIIEDQKQIPKEKRRSTPHKIQLCNNTAPLSPSRVLSQLPISSPPTEGKQEHSSAACGETVSSENSCMKREQVSKMSQNRKITEFFSVRRSVRKTKTTMLKERQQDLEEAILSQTESGLAVYYFERKGRGVVATQTFRKGEFVVEYAGELIDMNEAKLREMKYAQDENTGCYMYYFQTKNMQYCIDATAETGRFGRLVNHSRNGNLVPRVVMLKGSPHIVLMAKEDILPGGEIMYDYGDRSRESLQYHPWLAS